MTDKQEDRLGHCWARQRRQQEMFNLDPKMMSPMTKAQVAKDLSLGLYEEACELASDVSRFKAHILKNKPIEKVNLADEAADVFKYLVAICQLYNLEAEDLFQAFLRKSDVVEDKARGEQLELETNTKLILVDMDNVIADLSGWQRKLNEARGGAPMNDRTVALLESLKEDFYRNGGFIDLPAIEGASEGMKVLRELGYKLVIISARPYWQYKRLYADTLQWLQNHDVVYDLILFNKDKAEAIYEDIFPARPAFLIEDRDKHAMEVAGIGVPVVLLDWEYNRNLADSDLIHRVIGWQGIVEHTKGLKS